MILLVLFLLFPSMVWSAQKVTIPVGTTIYGPITTTKANKYCSVSIDRSLWTDPNTVLTGSLEYSTDGGKTFVSRYGFIAVGGGDTSQPTTITAPQVTNATHVQVRVTVTGSAISATVPPAGQCK